MRSHLKEADTTAPYPSGPFMYYTRTTEGISYKALPAAAPPLPAAGSPPAPPAQRANVGWGGSCAWLERAARRRVRKWGAMEGAACIGGVRAARGAGCEGRGRGRGCEVGMEERSLRAAATVQAHCRKPRGAEADGAEALLLDENELAKGCARTQGRADGRADRRADGRADGRKDGRKDGRWTDGRTIGRMGGSRTRPKRASRSGAPPAGAACQPRSVSRGPSAGVR